MVGIISLVFIKTGINLSLKLKKKWSHHYNKLIFGKKIILVIVKLLYQLKYGIKFFKSFLKTLRVY